MPEEIIWKTPEDTETGNGLQNRISITQEEMAIIDKWDVIEVSFCTVKETITGVKETARR